MRAIKFRVWNLYSGEHSMWDWDKMLSHEDNEPGWLRNVFNSQYEDCHIMQYTGLLDKNGKEIYEGDIVKTGEGTTGICWEVYYGGEFDYPAFELRKWEGEVNGLMHFMCDPDEEFGLEVVGNIYENAELLK